MGRERTGVAAPAAPEAAAASRAPSAAAAPSATVVAPSRSAPRVPPGAGNAAISRAAHGRVQTMRVSSVSDPHEREAEAVASRIVASARAGGGGPTVSGGAARAAARLEDGGGADAPGGPVGREGGLVPEQLRGYLGDPGSGAGLAPAVAATLSAAFGADLSGVRVHTGEAAERAAAQLGARAFTVGRDIWVGAGESPADLALMAHEVTHVVQQGAVPVGVGAVATTQAPSDAEVGPARLADVAREGAPAAEEGPGLLSVIGEELAALAKHVPGYTLLTVIAGYDPIACEGVPRTPERLLEGLLDLVPFGSDIVARLRSSELLGQIAATIEGGLLAHNLTKERFLREIAQTWDEMSVLEGIDGNLAILGRHLRAVMTDVMAFAGQMVEEALALVRRAAVGLAETALLSPGIEPTWRLATKVFKHDPLRDTPVEAPTEEILGDFLHLAGRDEVLGQLRERGALQKAAEWIDTQLARFGGLLSEAVALFTDAWAAIQPANIARLADTVTSLAQRAFALVGRIMSFVTDLLAKLLELVKDALLGWLSKVASGTRGFPLMTVVLGQDPFTGAPVARSAENLIKGFICLLPGGEATYAKLAESGVIAQAGAKIEGEMQRLGINLEMVTGLFTGIWNSLSLQDLLDPIGAFTRVIDQFLEPIQRLIDFVSTVVGVVVDLILRLMDFPSDLIGSILGNVMSSIDKIGDDPVGFIVHLLEALKSGVMSFLSNIGSHLAQGLTSWLTRGLGKVGITVPEDFSLKGVLGLVLDVLGLSVETLWTKLGEEIGPEKVAAIRDGAAKLGEAWAFVAAVQAEGLTAIWRFVADKLEGLWDGLLAAAEDWVLTEIVEAAAAKLLSMLDPTGIMAVVNSFIAFFRAVQSAIDYLRDILAIVDQYVSTIAAIAAGNIAPGAAKLEAALAAGIPVAIGFLAAQVGLSNVPEKLVELIQGLRALIDEALTWLVKQAVRVGGNALTALGFGGPADADPAAPAGAPAADAASDRISEPVRLGGELHHLVNDGPGGSLVLHSDPVPVATMPDARVRALLAEYNAAPTKAMRKMKALEIAQAIAAVSPDRPGASAPGLGEIQKHGSKPPGLTTSGVRLWHLQSEHVIPFVVMRGLWDVLGTHGPEASRKALHTEDAALTTIMIYRDAAELKNSRESARRSSLSDEFGQMMDRYWNRADAGEERPEQTMRKWVLRALTREGQWYVSLTRDVVRDEHAMPASGGLTHGSARAEAAPLPPESAIADAVRQEIADATAILDEALTELRTDEFPEPGKPVLYTPVKPGPLLQSIAVTFRSATYTGMVLDAPLELYRFYGGKAGPIGGFWSRTRPEGPIQAQIDSALNPAWGNTLQRVSTIVVPAGTTVYDGAAQGQSIALKGWLQGGGNQVFIPKVDPAWLVSQ